MQAFDDVVRKTRLKEDGERYQKRIELDHEKSKLSLSQIYEQEYLKLRDVSVSPGLQVPVLLGYGLIIT